MFEKISKYTRRYWPLSLLLAAAGLAGIFELSKLPTMAQVVLALASLGIGLLLLVSGWQDARSGLYRINLLTPLAITATVLTRHFWIALVAAIIHYMSLSIAELVYQRARSASTQPAVSLPTEVSIVRGRKIIRAAVDTVHIGDKLLCQNGEFVVFDGQLTDGETRFDERLLGGQAEVGKQIGDGLLSGSRNTGQTVTMKVLRPQAESYFQAAAQLAHNAIEEQTTFVRLSDRYSLYFTLSAVVIAAAAWYGSHQSSRFASVLLAATIVPLELTGRIALRAAISAAARQGILVRSGAVLQKLAQTATMAFGFSGIITEGQPVVSRVTAQKPYTRNEVLGMAAGLEQSSEHPLAHAIVMAAGEQGFNFIKAKHVQSLRGQGLQAIVQGKDILVGNASLLTEHGVTIPTKATATQLAVYVASSGQLAGIIYFQDNTRDSVRPSFAALRRSGVDAIQILSSAPRETVAAAMSGLGKLEIHADQSVADKLAVLSADARRPVIFASTAGADASLLTVAAVGITLGVDGNQAANGADITILQPDITAVVTARTITRRGFGIARQSLLLGTVLSLALMLLSMTGKVPLLVGASLPLLINLLACAYAERAGSQQAQ